MLAEGLEVTGNGTLNPLVVESSCNAIVHARIRNSLLLLILPPDGRQRVRRVFYFKQHLPPIIGALKGRNGAQSRNLGDFQMGVGCWPMGIAYRDVGVVKIFTVPRRP